MSFSAVQSRRNVLQQTLWTLVGALGATAAETTMATNLHDIAARVGSLRPSVGGCKG